MVLNRYQPVLLPKTNSRLTPKFCSFHNAFIVLSLLTRFFYVFRNYLKSDEEQITTVSIAVLPLTKGTADSPKGLTKFTILQMRKDRSTYSGLLKACQNLSV